MKKIFFIIGFFVTIGAILILLSQIKKSPVTTTNPTPSITLVPINQNTKSNFSVVSIIPSETTSPLLPTQKLTVTFSQPVSPEKIKLTTNPSVSVEIMKTTNPQVVYIVPSTKWDIGVIMLTIQKDTTSSTNLQLSSPYNYRFYVDIPPGPDPDIIVP